MKRIAVIVCWCNTLHEFPWYLQYFLHSCSFNRTIDFFIFSDSIYKQSFPGNVHFIELSKEKIKKLASKKLGFKVTLHFPYKICDFRPAFGRIFEDYIKGYDFWAQSDIDIIFGNLRNFFTKRLLNTYDLINLRPDFVRGCFLLYRNNEFVNNLYTKSKDFKKIFTTEQFWGFDELNNKRWEILKFGKNWDEIKTEIETFTEVVKKAERDNQLNALFDLMLLEGNPGKIKFTNGILIYQNRFEVPLYHMKYLRKVYQPVRPLKKIPDQYFISSNRIYLKS